MDHVFVKFGAGGAVEDIVIVESKFAAKGGMPKLVRDTMERQQLSGAWLEKHMEIMFERGIHTETWSILKQNRDKIRFKGNVLDKNGINRWTGYVVGDENSKTAIRITKGF
jgi:hypothetical protein